MKALKLFVFFFAISLNGYSQDSYQCNKTELRGYWEEVPGAKETITFLRITEAKSKECRLFIIIGEDSTVAVKRGFARCGNDPSLNEPLPHWVVDTKCNFHYYEPASAFAIRSYNVTSLDDRRLVLQRIK